MKDIRFKQIATSLDGQRMIVIGLDDEGKVWAFDETKKAWKPFPMVKIK